jgi:foldase protein PrsA
MKNKSNLRWKLSSLLVTAAFVIYVFQFPPTTQSEAVAKVNGVSIGKEQLYQAALASSGSQILDSLIDTELIRQEAGKAGIQIQDAEVEKELEATKQNFSSEAEFNQALEQYGMTLDSLKENVVTQLMVEKLLEPQTTVTEEEVKQYYDANLESLQTPEKLKAARIVVATKEQADTILNELKNGADFAAVAKEQSLDTSSKENGGALGYVARGETEEAFETAAFALEIGKLSDVVETEDGYQIIKALDRQPAATPTLDEKKEEIRAALVREEISSLASGWLEQKKSEASIENFYSSVVNG